MNDPANSQGYYDYMRSRWLDSTSLIYGGFGHQDIGGYGPQCRYMFPGESDTLTGALVARNPMARRTGLK